MNASSILAAAILVAADAGVNDLAAAFFPKEANFDVSQQAIIRWDRSRAANEVREDATHTKNLLAWALSGMNERPLSEYSGKGACRLMLLLHRTIVVATVVTNKNTTTLTLKRYVQGSAESGIGVDATRVVDLDRTAAESIRAGFDGTGLWHRDGFRRNEAYKDGEANPLIGIWFAECARGARYGNAMFESPVDRSGPEGTAIKTTLDRILDAGGKGFLTEGQLAEMF